MPTPPRPRRGPQPTPRSRLSRGVVRRSGYIGCCAREGGDGVFGAFPVHSVTDSANYSDGTPDPRDERPDRHPEFSHATFLAIVSVGDDTSLSSFSFAGAKLLNGPGRLLKRFDSDGWRRKAVASGVRNTSL